MPRIPCAAVEITSYCKRKSQNRKIAWMQRKHFFWHPHGMAICQESIKCCKREISIPFIRWLLKAVWLAVILEVEFKN
jgi:hypothetical protein